MVFRVDCSGFCDDEVEVFYSERFIVDEVLGVGNFVLRIYGILVYWW